MKALIVYSSQSGNTQKLAESIYDNLTVEKRMLPISEAPLPENDEVVFVGFWLQGGKPDPKAAEYLSGIGSAQLFLFATHGAAADSKHARGAMDYARSLVPSATVLGSFNCQGEVNSKVLEKVSRKEPPPPWIADAGAAVGHPDEGDIDNLKAAVRALGLA